MFNWIGSVLKGIVSVAFAGLAVIGLGHHSAPTSNMATSSQAAVVASISPISPATQTNLTKTDSVSSDVHFNENTPTQSKPAPTFTTPSGAVIDNNGNAISVPVQQTAPNPPPNSTYCNGNYYSSCPTGQNIVCPTNGGTAYCKNNQPQQISQPTSQPQPQAQPQSQAQIQSQPQPIDQVGMNTFLADAAAAITNIENKANGRVSAATSKDCSNVGDFTGWVGAACTDMYQGVSAIETIQNWANSIKNPYRSSSCDSQISNALEQLLKAEVDETNNLLGLLGGGEDEYSYEGQVNQIKTTANAQISALATQAQGIAASCQ
jgi:hypothetical protein